jgi:hypothetical protein
LSKEEGRRREVRRQKEEVRNELTLANIFSKGKER